jgi:hypothetical protein
MDEIPPFQVTLEYIREDLTVKRQRAAFTPETQGGPPEKQNQVSTAKDATGAKESKQGRFFALHLQRFCFPLRPLRPLRWILDFVFPAVNPDAGEKI